MLSTMIMRFHLPPPPLFSAVSFTNRNSSSGSRTFSSDFSALLLASYLSGRFDLRNVQCKECIIGTDDHMRGIQIGRAVVEREVNSILISLLASHACT